jgi:rhamnosyltransferase
LCRQLKNQDVQPIIIDNGSDDISLPDDVLCSRQKENLGIARAQNIGIDLAINAGAEIIILFDQDSIISEGFIDSLVAPIRDGRAMISSPIYYDSVGGFVYPLMNVTKNGFARKIYPHSCDFEMRTNVAISSGLAFAVKIVPSVGLMNEQLFIDYVDTEWCIRAWFKGFDIFVSSAAKMNHSIGDKSTNIFGKRIPIHSPVRRYYRIRNALILLRHKQMPTAVFLREITLFFVHQVVIMLCDKDRSFEYGRFALRGVIDGI